MGLRFWVLEYRALGFKVWAAAQVVRIFVSSSNALRILDIPSNQEDSRGWNVLDSRFRFSDVFLENPMVASYLTSRDSSA